MLSNNLHRVSLALALGLAKSNPKPATRSYLSSASSPSVSHPVLSAPRFVYTPEQRDRARQYQALHFLFGHPNDKKLCLALDNNLIPGVCLSSADYQAFHDLFGPCPQCAMAKLRKESMLPSPDPPATRVGRF